MGAAKSLGKATEAQYDETTPDLFEVFQWFVQHKRSETATASTEPKQDAVVAVEEEAPKKNKKDKKAKTEEVEEAEVVEEPAVEQAPKKKKKKDKKAKEAVEEVAEVVEEVVEEPVKKKKKDKKNKEEAPVEEAENKRPAEDMEPETAENPEPPAKKAKVVERFERVDDAKWRAKLGNNMKLIDNTHEAKARYGGSAGDSWGDAAAGDMIKVKGKDFRKEMQKKKRASWRGTGELDQGVNSVTFDSDSD